MVVAAFGSRDEIFFKRRDESNLAGLYSSYVSQQLSQYSTLSETNKKIGALIMEPSKNKFYFILLFDSITFCILFSHEFGIKVSFLSIQLLF